MVESYDFTLNRILNLDVERLPDCDRIQANVEIATEWQNFFLFPINRIKSLISMLDFKLIQINKMFEDPK